MLIESLILSIAFIVCICALVVVSKGDEKSSSNTIESKQPEIHIYNNNNNSKTTDNVSEDMVKEKLAQLRNELEKKQRLDIEILDKLDELINK